MNLGQKVAIAGSRIFSKDGRNATSAKAAATLSPNGARVDGIQNKLRDNRAKGQQAMGRLTSVSLLVKAGLTRKEAESVLDATSKNARSPSLSAMGLPRHQALEVFNSLVMQNTIPSVKKNLGMQPSEMLLRTMQNAAISSSNVAVAGHNVVANLASFVVDKHHAEVEALLARLGAGIVGDAEAQNGSLYFRRQSACDEMKAARPLTIGAMLERDRAVFVSGASVAQAKATQRLRNGVAAAKQHSFTALVGTANGAGRALGATYGHLAVPAATAAAIAVGTPAAFAVGTAIGAPVLALGSIGALVGTAGTIVRDGITGGPGLGQRMNDRRDAMRGQFGWK